jgi:hypothetical protein
LPGLPHDPADLCGSRKEHHVMSSSTSPFVINVTFDTSVDAAPAGFTTAVMAAVSTMESLFTNPVTLNINVGFGEVGGLALGSETVGSSSEPFEPATYAQIVNAVTANAASAAVDSAVASLPSTSPVSGRFYMPIEEAKALGLYPAQGSESDGSIGFSSSLPFTYDDSGGVAAGTYDFNAIALRELSALMGRVLLNGEHEEGITLYSPYDLFHYFGPGVRDFSASTPGYFSVDGGATDLADFNTDPTLPSGDWGSSVVNDAFDAAATTGVVEALSTADVTALNVLGWDLDPVACFAAGTRILTATGEVEVGKLRPGDRIVSAFGGTVPVAWTGHRRVDCWRHPRPQEVWPVRVRAGAFGVSRPARDLLLSPDHAVFVGGDGIAPGVLVPIRYLINGTTIVRQRVSAIEYWHVELPQHDVILAEGLPTESYLDTGNRSAFEGGGPALQLHPDFAQHAWEAQACAPQITRGPILLAIRRHLATRAANPVRSRKPSTAFPRNDSYHANYCL